MKLQELTTRTDYNTIVTGATVDISYRDGLFLYHAFNALKDNMQKVQNEVKALADTVEPNEPLNNIAMILESMHNLLMPIAKEIVLPKQEIDIFNYVSAEEKQNKSINLKKKYQNSDTVVANYDMES